MRASFAIVCVAVAVLATVPQAQAGEEGDKWRFEDGRWRVELSGFGATYSGKTSRGGDSLFTASVEYEWPIFARVALGLRAYPLFCYHQHDPQSDIWGAGGGIAGRIYQHKGTLDGWYGEAAASAIWQSDSIEKNSSRVNFLTEPGVGYEFPDTNWHAALKVHHLSNAGLGSENTGTNGLGLSVGYRF